MYQDHTFDVPEVAGLVVTQLVGFTAGPSDDRPEKLVLAGADGRRFAFFLSAFIGYWDPVSDMEYEELLADYAGIRQVDHGARYQLVGARVIGARCFQSDTGTQIQVELDRGELRLTTLDENDPHSDSQLSFAPKP